MTDRVPPEIRALDEAAGEFDRLMRQVIAEADQLSVERAELERLQQVASVARMASMSFIVEAGETFIRERQAGRRRAALQ